MNKRLTVFIILALTLSWSISSAARVFHLSQTPLSAVMALPMLIAVVFMLVSREKFSSIGWKIPEIKYLLFCIALPICQIALVVGAGFSFGLLSINDKHIAFFVPTSKVWLNLILYIPAMFIPYLLLSLPRFFLGWINHLGEEFAWRGYLFRKLAENKGGLVQAVLLSGLVWWGWHVPMFWFSPVISGLNAGQLGLTLLLSLPSLLGTAFVYCWIYIKSKSIWAPTILHLFWNLFRGVLTGRLSDGEAGLFAGNLWLVNGEGIIGMAFSILTGIFFFFLVLQLQKKNPEGKEMAKIFTPAKNV